MGNCANTFVQRKKARKSFDFTNMTEAKSPLCFTIRSWPQSQNFYLSEAENCIQRSIDAQLNDGQTFEITLRTSQDRKQKISIAENFLNFSLKCRITKKGKSYTINFPLEEEAKYLWKFIGGLADFKQKDIVKMGKTKYRLAKLVNKEEKDVFKSIKQIQSSYNLELVHDENEVNVCRVCLSHQQSHQNPLISPCRCTGSIKYTHLKCLSHWLFNLNNDNAYMNIRVNKSICQLCKTDITGTPEYEKMKELLLGNANNVPAPYAIFEVFVKEQEMEKNYFILSFNSKKVYTIGRSCKADIFVTDDRSISKFNSQIIYRKERIFIKDCNSTHGTFMKIRNSLQLNNFNLNENVSYRNMIINACYNPANQV